MRERGRSGRFRPRPGGQLLVWLLSAAVCVLVWELAAAYVPWLMRHVFFGG